MKRTGQWVVPRRMEVKLTAGDVTLDFTRALIVQTPCASGLTWAWGEI
jgi:hypothetical protein